MRTVVVVMTQPAPCLVIGAHQLIERSGTELRMLREKPDDFERVHITDHTHTATPCVAVTVRQNQIPPQTHLLFKRRLKRIEDVCPSSSLCSFPNEPRVLVRISIETTSRRRVIGKQSTIPKWSRRTRYYAVNQRSIFQQPQLITDTCYARGYAKVVLRQVDYLLCLLIIKGRYIEELAPLLALLIRETLPDRI